MNTFLARTCFLAITMWVSSGVRRHCVVGYEHDGIARIGWFHGYNLAYETF